MTTAPRAIPPAINAWNAEYLEAQYRLYKSDPASVPPDLLAFFRGFDLARGLNGGAAATRADESGLRFQSAVDDLIVAYRDLGHLSARLDPFGRERERPAALSLAHHGLSEADLPRLVHTGSLKLPDRATLGAVLDQLEQTYCGAIAFEIMHVQNLEERSWLLDRVEAGRGRIELTRGQRVHVLEQLLRAEEFEKFIHRRYQGEKRFSLEGSESLIPLLDRLIEGAGELGVEEIVLGMAHRGRLNVLNNTLGKTYEQIFTEFEDNWEQDFADGGGDVKYHRGYSGEKQLPSGRTMHLAMASNPSHLEAVDPVVQGRCRAKQRVRGDFARSRVIPVLIHGDAAIAAQGMVAEVLNLSQLEGYTAGGTVHIVVNNLIGFTTPPEYARSSRYCTDVAKMVDAPVFHVNGEDPEAVVAAAQFAIEYRQRFHKDVFVDMYCFRRYGHNEGDEPSFTQPLLYEMISRKPGVLKTYAERLLAEEVITETDMGAIRRRLDEALDAAQQSARRTPYDPTIDPGSARWKGLTSAYDHAPAETGAPMEMIEEVCAALGRVPEGFSVHPKLKRLVLEVRASLPVTKTISYADAESLAIGTLLLEGTAVRLSGQDVRRGTFSHRHAILRDTSTGEVYIPLNNMRELGRPGTDAPAMSPGADGRPRQAQFCVHDSPLSEEAVLGFEYGYALADPNMLVMWEAQFGDFVNGAQVIIDQFLASAEAKWERWNGLVLLLPHGYEGAGPEHSSARIERFLQLCGNANMQVVYPSTGAQVFHVLRRQVRRNFRKPLIVATPKSLLREPTSTIDDLVRGGFREIIDDPAFAADPGRRAGVRTILLCTGKIYHELARRRDEIARRDAAIVRVEQLYPLHAPMLAGVLKQYPESADLAWVQEEPRNMGAFSFIDDALRTQLGVRSLAYIGRDAGATPAVGSKTIHRFQQEQIISRAVGPLSDAVLKEGSARPRGKASVR